jgi:hypothetical protein
MYSFSGCSIHSQVASALSAGVESRLSRPAVQGLRLPGPSDRQTANFKSKQPEMLSEARPPRQFIPRKADSESLSSVPVTHQSESYHRQ